MRVTKGRVLFFLLAALSNAASAQQLRSVETDKLRLLYFDPTETYLVPRVIQTFHNSADRQASILGYSPVEKITVLLTDFSDYGNAGATSVPTNSVVVDIAPLPLTFETSAPAERFYTIMNHELVHISNTDQPAPTDLRARRFFHGKVLATPEHPESILYQYLTNPRKTSPRWFLEGMAVFLETWMAGGLGRAQGAYDEMVFRSMVRDDAHFYDPLGLVAEGVTVDFQVGANAYLYGARFITYLAYTYSPEKVVEWAQRNEGSRRSYEEEFDRVFGRRLNDAWRDWIAFEHEFQKKNLDEIRVYPTTTHEQLVPEALGSVSRAFYNADRNSLIAGFRYPGVVSHIGELSLASGKVKKFADIKGPMVYRVSSVAYDADDNTVFYTTDNYAYRDLLAIDLNTGESRMLLKDVRIGELVLNTQDKALWGIRHLNGYAALVRIPYPYQEWNLIQSFPYGTVAYDLGISPDGTLLSGSIGNIEGKHSLQVHKIENLLDGKLEPVASFDFGAAIPEGFVFSNDGKYLYGSSYYTGVSNIFRFELENSALEAVSNTETGYFRPIPIDDETLIVFSYTGQGFVPVRIKAKPIEDVSAISFLGSKTIQKYPILETWRAGSPNDVIAETRITSEGDYKASRNLGTESLYPVVLGYKDSVSVGLAANFSDPIRLDTLKITAAYSIDGDLPSDERSTLGIDYKHAVVSSSPLSGSWRFLARLNHADFYDLFGPTKQSRKGNRFSVAYDKSLIFDEPRTLGLSVELNHYSNMDSLPRFQNVPATFDTLSTFGALLEYSNTRKSLGAVDAEKGLTWSMGTSASYVDGDAIPKVLGNFDFGFALPWKHSSIWLRTAAGAAFGSVDDEFANFFFGGFGNNYVDRGEIKRYREYFSMAGFELNELPGRNFHRVMLEWNLPPYRFERVGTPGFYMSWARPALFVSTLTTNFDDSSIQQEVSNAGIQIDFRFTILSRLDMTLSLGYAKGFGNSSILDDDEFMVSLKIL
ncbi:MAG: hypothetical protein E4H42_03270 [Chromatiales bacterium]|nr:MAG: hypothetical protein E4H42_03270 [Chromatiales bacterium]